MFARQRRAARDCGWGLCMVIMSSELPAARPKLTGSHNSFRACAPQYTTVTPHPPSIISSEESTELTLVYANAYVEYNGKVRDLVTKVLFSASDSESSACTSFDKTQPGPEDGLRSAELGVAVMASLGRRLGLVVFDIFLSPSDKQLKA